MGQAYCQSGLAGAWHVYLWGKSKLPQCTHQVAEGQAHDAGITTLQGLHRVKTMMLDRISSGFVQRVAALHISQNLLVRIFPHRHLRGAQVGQQAPMIRAIDRQRGENIVGVAAQVAQHGGCFGSMSGFSQDLQITGLAGV